MPPPLAFGEIGVKERVKNVLRYKKPIFWLIAVALIACAVLAVCFLTNLKENESSESAQTSITDADTEQQSAESEFVTMRWFDIFQSDNNPNERTRMKWVDELPGVTFHWQNGDLKAVAETETVYLFNETGAESVESVYFCDLTGDGKPEICSTVSVGSGMTDDRIMVYDYVNGKTYEKSARFYYDYRLNLKSGQLTAEKRIYNKQSLLASGKLVIEDGKLQIQFNGSPVGNTSNGYDIQYYSSLVYANPKKDRDNNGIFVNSLNPKEMTVSSVRHLHVFRISSRVDWLEGLEPYFRDEFDMAQGHDDVLSINEFIKAQGENYYNDSYFDDYSLILCYVESQSGSFRYDVRDVYCDGESLCVYVEQTNEPESYTDDIAGWFVIVRVLAEDIADCTAFDAQLVSAEEYRREAEGQSCSQTQENR